MDQKNKKILDEKGVEIFSEIEEVFNKHKLKHMINRIDFEEESDDDEGSRICPPGTRPVAQINPQTGEITYVCVPT